MKLKWFLLLLTLPISAQTIQINAGGPAVAPWVADTDFVGGSLSSTHPASVNLSQIAAPGPLAVYQTARFGAFTYTIPTLTPNATYTVNLHFSEPYWSGPKQRLFNVLINGTPVLTAFDIFATAGGQNKAIVQSFTATATAAGTIVIQFTAGSMDQPTVNGIEIIPVAVPVAATFTPGTVYPVVFSNIAPTQGSLAQAVLQKIPVNANLVLQGVLSGFSFNLSVNGVTLTCLTGSTGTGTLTLNCL